MSRPLEFQVQAMTCAAAATEALWDNVLRAYAHGQASGAAVSLHAEPKLVHDPACDLEARRRRRQIPSPIAQLPGCPATAAQLPSRTPLLPPGAFLHPLVWPTAAWPATVRDPTRGGLEQEAHARRREEVREEGGGGRREEGRDQSVSAV